MQFVPLHRGAYTYGDDDHHGNDDYGNDGYGLDVDGLADDLGQSLGMGHDDGAHDALLDGGDDDDEVGRCTRCVWWWNVQKRPAMQAQRQVQSSCPHSLQASGFNPRT
jgi:hypothetical protein